MTRAYIAWTTTNLELSGPRILAIAPTREEAETEARNSLPHPATDITADTEHKNLHVESETAFRNRFGKGADQHIDQFLATDA